MFRNPSINELLSTCLYGTTQNNNKSLNSIISKRQKDVYVGRTTLSIGASSAVINFNNGTHGTQVMQEYGLKDDVFCTNFCIS